MFDRTVLCTQGNSLHASIRTKSLVIQDMGVFFITRAFSDLPSNLSEVTYEILLEGNSLASGVVQMQSRFSSQSELHVVAQGPSESGTGEDSTLNTGYYVVVVVNGLAILCAKSDELLRIRPRLQMTFDIEESNGILQTSADFDGDITQGILEDYLQEYTKTQDLASVALSNSYDDLDDKPYIPVAGNGTVSIKKRSSDESVASFSLNDSSDTEVDLGLGTAADANVCTSLSSVSPEEDSALVSRSQAMVLAQNASAPKSVAPTSETGVVVPVGAYVWLALSFTGEVGLVDFNTTEYVSQDDSEVIPHPQNVPEWSGSVVTDTCAFIVRIKDSLGKLVPTTQAIAPGQRFRTLNACTSGSSFPSFGFALCVRIEDVQEEDTDIPVRVAVCGVITSDSNTEVQMDLPEQLTLGGVIIQGGTLTSNGIPQNGRCTLGSVAIQGGTLTSNSIPQNGVVIEDSNV